MQIVNSTFTNGNGIVIGSEAVNGVYNVVARNIVENNTGYGLLIKSSRARGSRAIGNYNIMAQNLSGAVAASHLHKGDPGVAGGVVVTLSATLSGTAPHLTARKGSVVNVSSVNGLRSFPGVLAYCVSKAGVDQLTRCAALELAPLGVRVNAVNPGVTVTNLHRRSGMPEAQYAAFLERSKTTHPLGRPGNPEEIASLILYLASDRAGWMTGETIPIDGGRHLTCAR